jgi:hypothetical protein
MGGGGTKRCRKIKRDSELVLVQQKGSVTRRGGVMTLARGEAAPGRKKEETTLVGLTRILLDQKMKKIHMIDSAGINER